MLQAWVAMGGNASATEKLRQQAAWQKQTFNPRDSAASASQVCSRTALRMSEPAVIKMQAMIRTHVGTLVRPHDAECVVSPCRSCLAPFTDMFIEGFFRFSAALEPTMMLGSCAEVLPSAG